MESNESPFNPPVNCKTNLVELTSITAQKIGAIISLVSQPCQGVELGPLDIQARMTTDIAPEEPKMTKERRRALQMIDRSLVTKLPPRIADTL